MSTDYTQLLLWMTVGTLAVIGAMTLLFRRDWRQALLLMLGSAAVLLVLLFPRPPLWAAALLDLGLVAVLAWRLRPSPPRHAYKPRLPKATHGVQ